jgi:glycosyltransferase involved in cell wall biosynthesis
MTKLIIQVPCYNEEATLPGTLAALPRSVKGVDLVEWLVIDDGSTDRTVEIARAAGVDHVVRLPRNQGLAKAFLAGLDASIRAGADVIVNTDADNQYDARDIPALITPIINGQAELVVGTRPIEEIAHFSFAKKLLQKAGSMVVRYASATSVPDAPSGFRAMSRDAAMKLSVFNEYTYTLETLIQAGQKGMAVASVPVRVNPPTRPSKLVRSTGRYVFRSAVTILRVFVTYRPFRFFATLGIFSFLLGMLAGLRFLYLFFTGSGTGHVQSVILSALLLGTGFLLILVGFLADLVSVNRKLLERVDYRLKRIESELGERRG